jgi:hypothetical protein
MKKDMFIESNSQHVVIHIVPQRSYWIPALCLMRKYNDIPVGATNTNCTNTLPLSARQSTIVAYEIIMDNRNNFTNFEMFKDYDVKQSNSKN